MEYFFLLYRSILWSDFVHPLSLTSYCCCPAPESSVQILTALSPGVGYETNKAYRRDGYRTQQHSQEDYSFHFELDKDLCLYGVFDGHDSLRAAHFAHQRMPGESERHMDGGGATSVNRQYAWCSSGLDPGASPARNLTHNYMICSYPSSALFAAASNQKHRMIRHCFT